MPRYQFDLTTDTETASALVQLAMASCTQFSFRLVEDMEMKVLEPPKKNGTHKRVKGTTTYAEVYELCRISATNTATRARVIQHLTRMGFAETSAGPAMSRLVLTGLFERHKDGIRMLSDKTTLDQVKKKVESYQAELNERKKS